MSRQNPKWGRTVNYPAGGNPWNAQPTKVDPGTDIFTPDTDAVSTYVNYVLRRQTIEAVQAGQHASASKFVHGVPGLTIKGLCYARDAGGWLMIADNAGTYDIYFIDSFDNSIGGPTINYRANIGGNPPEVIGAFGNGKVFVGEDTATGKQISTGGINNSTGFGVGTHWSRNGFGQISPATSAGFLVGKTATNACMYKTATSGLTWTVVANPAAFNTYHPDHGWDFAGGDGVCSIFIPNDGTLGSVLRWDGSSATSVAVASAVVAGCYDAEWNEGTGRFLVFCISGSDTLVYASTTNATAFSAGPIATLTGIKVKKAACSSGVIWVQTSGSANVTGYLNSDTSNLPESLMLYAFSEDVATWYKASNKIADTATPITLAVGDFSIVTWTDVDQAESGHVGFRSGTTWG